MEVSALKHRPALRGPTPLLRLQGDERLVALARRGNASAYEVLVSRYEARLLAFCRHMLSSREDAEDVLQEVFAAAYSAMRADERPINVRPWLYRIARNRSLNHLRKASAIGVDSMDVHLADHGTSTADRVHKREAFQELVGDVKGLPESQRTALLLREMDALSYEQIAQAMETTVPAVKSLLVRARVGLAEAAEARALTCEEVRGELGEVAEGLKRRTPPVRRHVRGCERCQAFDQRLSRNNRALAAVFPVGPLLLLKKFLIAQSASSAAGAASAVGGGAAAAGAGAAASAGAGSAVSAGLATLATKTAAVVAGAAIVTAGAVEVDHSRSTPRATLAAAAPAVRPAPAPRVVATTPQPVRSEVEAAREATASARKAAAAALVAAAADAELAQAATATAPGPVVDATVGVAAVPTATTGAAGVPGAAADTPAGEVDSGSDVVVLPTPAERPAAPTYGPVVTAQQPQLPAAPAVNASPEPAAPVLPVDPAERAATPEPVADATAEPVGAPGG